MGKTVLGLHFLAKVRVYKADTCRCPCITVLSKKTPLALHVKVSKFHAWYSELYWNVTRKTSFLGIILLPDDFDQFYYNWTML